MPEAIADRLHPVEVEEPDPGHVGEFDPNRRAPARAQGPSPEAEGQVVAVDPPSPVRTPGELLLRPPCPAPLHDPDSLGQVRVGITQDSLQEAARAGVRESRQERSQPQARGRAQGATQDALDEGLQLVREEEASVETRPGPRQQELEAREVIARLDHRQLQLSPRHSDRRIALGGQGPGTEPGCSRLAQARITVAQEDLSRPRGLDSPGVRRRLLEEQEEGAGVRVEGILAPQDFPGARQPSPRSRRNPAPRQDLLS